MTEFRARIEVGPEPEARRVAEVLQAALGEEVPVSWSETAPQAWAVDAYWEGEAEPAAATLRAALAAIAPDLAAEIAPLPQTDWVAESLRGLPPVRAGRFVVHGSHDRARVTPGLIGIEIEAAQAFGTGHHGTTAGCLVALTDLLKRLRFASPVDLGTGSGVLAIAYAKATRAPILASDIDPLAVRIARENARANGVGDLVRIETAAGFGHPALRERSYDLVIANILAGPLIALAPAIRKRMAAPGALVLSGLLAAQAPRVDAAFRTVGFVRDRTLLREGWATLVMRLPMR